METQSMEIDGPEFQWPDIREDLTFVQTIPERVKQLSAREASRLLTVLDRFTEVKAAQGVFLAWPLSRLNEIEKDFLIAGQKEIKSNFMILSLDFKVYHSSETGTSYLACFSQTNPSQPLSASDLHPLIQALINRTSQRGLYDYTHLFASATDACKQIFMETLTPSFSKECLAKLGFTETSMILPSGFPDTLDDEVGYGTAAVFGCPTIFYCNPNLFRPDHFTRAALFSRFNDRKRVYRDYAFQMIAVPPHEIVHCLQTLVWKTEVSEWRKELEASIPAFGLLHDVIQRYPFLYPHGYGFESMINMFDSARQLHETKISEETKKSYQLFRNCFGKEGETESPLPEGKGDVMSHPLETWYMKVRLQVEAYSAMKNGKWKEFVSACLKEEQPEEKGKEEEQKKKRKREVEYPKVGWQEFEDMILGKTGVVLDVGNDLKHLV